LGDPVGTNTKAKKSPFVTDASLVNVPVIHVLAVIDPEATVQFVFVPRRDPEGSPDELSDSSLTSVSVGVVVVPVRKWTLWTEPV
jgi:hypothetical protein